MIQSKASVAAFLAALLLTTSPRAAPPAPASAPARAAPPAPVTAAPPARMLGWANLGIYDVRFSTPIGTASDAEFGIGAGGAMNLAQLAPDVPLAGFVNVAISFASGGQFFPLTAGVAMRYDKLPVQFLGGLGLTLMPNSAGSNTGVGAGLLLMGLYPLRQVDPRLSAQGQIQFHLLTNSLSLLEFVIGAGYSL
jgi:hypothetical protein